MKKSEIGKHGTGPLFKAGLVSALLIFAGAYFAVYVAPVHATEMNVGYVSGGIFNPYLFVATAIAMAPSGSYAYVTSPYGGESIAVVSTETQTVSNVIPLGSASSPFGVAFTPNGTYAYVGNQGSGSFLGNVLVINTGTGKVVHSINNIYFPHAVAIAPSGKYAYVSGELPPGQFLNGHWTNTYLYGIVIINITSNKPVGIITNLGGGITGIAFSPDGAYAYATVITGFYGYVDIINTTTGEVVGKVENSAGNGAASIVSPNGVAFSSDGSRAYVVSLYGQFLSEPSVYVIDTTTNRVIGGITQQTYSAGSLVEPTGIATLPDSTLAYVSNRMGDWVTIINTLLPS